MHIKVNIEIDGIQYPLCSHSVNTDINTQISQLHKKVFIFDTSPADEIYFKKRIINFLLDKDFETFTKVLLDATWIRNEKGRYSKYRHLDERVNKSYLDGLFFKWAKLTSAIIQDSLIYLEDFVDQ